MRKCYPLKKEYLHRAVNTVNELHEFVNGVIPEVIVIMKNAKLLKSGRVDKKSREQIAEILQHAPKPIRAWLTTSEYSARVEFKTDYPVSEHGCSYYDCTIYVKDWNHPENTPEFTPRPIYILDKIIANFKKYESAFDAYESVRKEAQNAETSCGPFFER